MNIATEWAIERNFEEAARFAEKAYLLSGAPEPEPDMLEQMYTLLVAGDSSLRSDVLKEAEGFGVTLTITKTDARGHFEESYLHARKEIPSNLPSSATAFVGRDPEITEISKLLANSETRLVTLLPLRSWQITLCY